MTNIKGVYIIYVNKSTVSSLSLQVLQYLDYRIYLDNHTALFLTDVHVCDIYITDLSHSTLWNY